MLAVQRSRGLPRRRGHGRPRHRHRRPARRDAEGLPHRRSPRCVRLDAPRRWGRPERVDEYLEEIRRRDAADTGRAVAPLRIPAARSCSIPASSDVDACVEAIVERLERDRCVAGSGTRARPSPAFLARLLFRRADRGRRARAANGPVHPRLESLLERRPADPRLGDRAPGRPRHPLHGQDRDAQLADHRLAGDTVGRLFRPPRRGRSRCPALLDSRRWPRVGRSACSPKGTRSRDGHLKAVKSGAAFLAMRSGAPLLPVGIAGTHRIFPGRSRWPHPTRDQRAHRRAVHAAASAGRPARSRGADRGDRSDHASRSRSCLPEAQRRVR